LTSPGCDDGDGAFAVPAAADIREAVLMDTYDFLETYA